MDFQDYFEVVQNEVENENQRSNFIRYTILTGENQQFQDKEFDNECDIRLSQTAYLNSSLTILAYMKESKILLGKATLFFEKYDLYKQTFFWRKKADESVLEKIYLERFKDAIGEECVTMGYTQTSHSSHRVGIGFAANMALLYYKLMDLTINRLQLFAHVEPCGVYFLSHEQLNGELLPITDVINQSLGSVYPESKPSFQMAQKLNMVQREDLFHASTLGPVFFSKK